MCVWYVHDHGQLTSQNLSSANHIKGKKEDNPIEGGIECWRNELTRNRNGVA